MKNSHRNILALAYLGDSVYELYIREYLLNKGIEKVNDLQKASVKYVSARGQAKFLNDMLEQGLLTEEELTIVYRARNHKGSSHPKNTDIVTYKYATGLEALIGWLYLENNSSRIDELMKYIFDNH
ncbi:MAG: ribonuclease III domain-containing protein [Bacilli bacterium]|nr:ribonuclease III domain-containing protein [Bacilli bacterium]MDD4808855.1 ribonuclease III domain-containing protein [Bacilli bacterium]